MAKPTFSFAMFVIFMVTFSFLYSSSATDMSIITYDQTHMSSEFLGRTDEEVSQLYESWLVKHGKSYNAIGEKEKRFEIFKDNLRYIDEQNNVPNRSYKLGLNRFADLSNEEYRNTYLGAKTDAKRRFSKGVRSDRYAPKVGDSLPESIDWREKGAVVAVKDQGSCGKPLFVRKFFGQSGLIINPKHNRCVKPICM